MANTPLQILIDACAEIGLVQPTVVASSTDTNIIRLLAMLNREGRDLARARDWTVLTRTHSFTTVTDQDEYDLPSDYDHLINDTEWDREGLMPLQGPLNPRDWETIQSGGPAGTGTGRRYRLVRSASSTTRKIVISPTPDVDDDELAFEYVSNGWCTASNGTTLKTAFTVDTDLALLNQDLLTLGTIVRFKRSVGLDYSSEADEYNQALNREKSRDRPSRTLSMAGGGFGIRLLDESNFNPSGLGS